MPDPALDAVPAAEQNRRRLLLLGGVATAAVAVGVGAFVLVGGSDPGSDTVLLPARTTVSGAGGAARPVPSGGPKVAAALPPPSKEQLGRDPFAARYVAPVAAAPAAVPAAGGSQVVGAVPVAVPAARPVPAVQPVAVQPFPVALPIGPGLPRQLPVPTDTQHALAFASVGGSESRRTARFRIDGATTDVAVGTRFGPTGELLLRSLQQGPAGDQWTAVLQVGDGSPFDLVTGTATSVR